MKRAPLFIPAIALLTLFFASPRLSHAQSTAQPQPLQTQFASAQQAPLRVDADVMVEKLVHVVRPVYPQIAQMAHVSGPVVLHAIIATDGTIRALTFISGPALLRAAAMNAVRQWRFKPTLLNGQPVEVDTTLPIHFDCCGPGLASKAVTQDDASSRAMLTESVDVMYTGKKQNWVSFLGVFENASSRAWLSAIPRSVANDKGTVSVEFDMRRDGGIDGVLWLTRSSRDPAIDDAARLAMRECAPFHGVPTDFPYPTVNFRVTFAYDHPHPIAPATGAAQ